MKLSAGHITGPAGTFASSHHAKCPRCTSWCICLGLLLVVLVACTLPFKPNLPIGRVMSFRSLYPPGQHKLFSLFSTLDTLFTIQSDTLPQLECCCGAAAACAPVATTCMSQQLGTYRTGSHHIFAMLPARPAVRFSLTQQQTVQLHRPCPARQLLRSRLVSRASAGSRHYTEDLPASHGGEQPASSHIVTYGHPDAARRRHEAELR